MANDFKLYCDSLTTTSETTLITATGSSVYIISSIIIANTHASTASTADLTINDLSEAADFNILTSESFSAGLSREILSRPLVLENGDGLKITAGTANILDVMVSYLDRNRD